MQIVQLQTLRCRLDILVRLRFDGQECPSYESREVLLGKEQL